MYVLSIKQGKNLDKIILVIIIFLTRIKKMHNLYFYCVIDFL